jgi:hypothetical protein
MEEQVTSTRSAGELRSSDSGNGGAIALSTTGGNITTGIFPSVMVRYAREYYSFCYCGNRAMEAGNISLSVPGTGAINTTAGTGLNATSPSGNGGAIALSTAGGNITTSGIDSRSSGAGKGGNITLSVTGGPGAIDTAAGSSSVLFSFRKWRCDRTLKRLAVTLLLAISLLLPSQCNAGGKHHPQLWYRKYYS